MRCGTYSVIRQFADALRCFVTNFLSSVQEVVTRLPNVFLLDPGRRYHRRQNRTRNQAGDADQPGIGRQLIANLIARPAGEVACTPRPVKNSAASVTNRAKAQHLHRQRTRRSARERCVGKAPANSEFVIWDRNARPTQPVDV
jgi:hypothetical protein